MTKRNVLYIADTATYNANLSELKKIGELYSLDIIYTEPERILAQLNSGKRLGDLEKFADTGAVLDIKDTNLRESLREKLRKKGLTVSETIVRISEKSEETEDAFQIDDIGHAFLGFSENIEEADITFREI